MNRYPKYPKTISDAAKLLDKENPGWEKKIDINNIKMNSGNHCILGQLYGHYNTGFIQLFGKNPIDIANSERGPFGYYTESNGWIIEINNRLGKSTVPSKAKLYAQIAELCGKVGEEGDRAKYNDLAIFELLAM